MSNEPHDVQTANPSRRAAGSDSPLRFVLVFGLLIVSLPFLMMLLMMMGMGWVGPPMHGGMAGQAPRILPVLGFLAFVFLVGVLYAAYRLSTVDEPST